MISLQRSMHSSQMYTPGPAMSFLTCFWLFPQKEHFSRSPVSPTRATDALLCVRTCDFGRATDCRRYLLRGRKSPAKRDSGATCRTRCGGGSVLDLAGVDDLVDDPVLPRLLGGENGVAL